MRVDSVKIIREGGTGLCETREEYVKTHYF